MNSMKNAFISPMMNKWWFIRPQWEGCRGEWVYYFSPWKSAQNMFIYIFMPVTKVTFLWKKSVYLICLLYFQWLNSVYLIGCTCFFKLKIVFSSITPTTTFMPHRHLNKVPAVFFTCCVQGVRAWVRDLAGTFKGPCPWTGSLLVGLEEEEDAPCLSSRRTWWAAQTGTQETWVCV